MEIICSQTLSSKNEKNKKSILLSFYMWTFPAVKILYFDLFHLSHDPINFHLFSL